MKIFLPIVFFSLFIVGCSTKKENVEKTQQIETKQVKNTKTQFDHIEGFHEDDLDLAFDVFKKACEKSYRKQIFRNVCANTPYYTNGKKFFIDNFTPKVMVSSKGDLGLITGYYEPLLYGSRTKDSFYKYPVYKTPKDLITIRNKKAYPSFKRLRYKAKKVNGRYVPYDTRAQIEKRDDLEPIVYVNDKISLFFLQVQGSGRVQLDTGEIINVGYANQNGRKYFAIGKKLVEDGYLLKEEVSLQTIRSFLEQNPHKLDEVLNSNASYVFFKEKDKTATGSLDVPLVAKRNIAVDRNYIPLGMPIFIQTFNPKTKEPLNRLVIAADTGGAIKGEIRADYFFGYGSEAEELAGLMKEKGRLFMLIPKI